MSRSIRQAVLCATAALALCVTTTGARAASPTDRRVWIEVRPRSAVRVLGAFASNVALACDAMGGECVVARTEDEATERATLFCDDRGPWTVGLARPDDADAEAIVVALTGDREERLRRAAMWVARTHLRIGAVAPPASSDLPAVDAADGDETPLDPSLRPYPFPFAVDQPARKRRPPRPPARLGVALTGSAGVGTGTLQWGLNAQLSFPLWHSFYWGPFASYQIYGDDLLGGEGPSRAPLGRGALGGMTVGWGAPFDDQWFGFSFTVGGGATWGSGSWVSQSCASSSACPAASVTNGSGATGLLRSAFGVQVPVKGWPVRPTLSTATNFSSPLGAFAFTQTLDLGLVWQAL